jgi:alkylation response protein AidB-like acyl-CoA dehydrogenase
MVKLVRYRDAVVAITRLMLHIGAIDDDMQRFPGVQAPDEQAAPNTPSASVHLLRAASEVALSRNRERGFFCSRLAELEAQQARLADFWCMRLQASTHSPQLMQLS